MATLGLRAASAARPPGHSLRECSLRHPACAVARAHHQRATCNLVGVEFQSAGSAPPLLRRGGSHTSH